jgi:hypothetical protein
LLLPPLQRLSSYQAQLERLAVASSPLAAPIPPILRAISNDDMFQWHTAYLACHSSNILSVELRICQSLLVSDADSPEIVFGDQGYISN